MRLTLRHVARWAPRAFLVITTALHLAGRPQTGVRAAPVSDVGSIELPSQPYTGISKAYLADGTLNPQYANDLSIQCMQKLENVFDSSNMLSDETVTDVWSMPAFKLAYKHAFVQMAKELVDAKLNALQKRESYGQPLLDLGTKNVDERSFFDPTNIEALHHFLDLDAKVHVAEAFFFLIGQDSKKAIDIQRASPHLPTLAAYGHISWQRAKKHYTMLKLLTRELKDGQTYRQDDEVLRAEKLLMTLYSAAAERRSLLSLTSLAALVLTETSLTSQTDILRYLPARLAEPGQLQNYLHQFKPFQPLPLKRSFWSTRKEKRQIAMEYDAFVEEQKTLFKQELQSATLRYSRFGPPDAAGDAWVKTFEAMMDIPLFMHIRTLLSIHPINRAGLVHRASSWPIHNPTPQVDSVPIEPSAAAQPAVEASTHAPELPTGDAPRAIAKAGLHMPKIWPH
ncbi:hypothetical protein CXG81DRAFT_19408 [Caulochytrium protostelioides]|uniref:Uncharacterized protein n=1 Tax=Caulochytrium protostelioides TaxID=1555241 RepID=A0A4P9X6A9_9FUNG|nr:hypothetical protein CXG81DRAFT_19408 [Caulochytrium protostelioides]|eukprot:RKP00682.1 hypothetical protein CXG81DRAFT_19408 [Caulochytrium protostelioides]